MNTYELVYIVDAHAPQNKKDEINKQVLDVLHKCDIKAIHNQVWLERHKMSFPIKKIIEGTYYLLTMEAKSAVIAKCESLLRIHDGVLRFLTVKLEGKT